MQAVVVLLLLVIVASLVKAMFHMSQGDRGGEMVRALTVRIVMSIALFGLLFLSRHFGWM